MLFQAQDKYSLKICKHAIGLKDMTTRNAWIENISYFVYLTCNIVRLKFGEKVSNSVGSVQAIHVLAG